MPPRPTAAPSLFSETPTPNPPAPKKTDWINAHCDGGARGNPGPAGYGALIQDDHGTVLAELSEFLGMRTNNYAEYSGLLACLQYALDHHHPRLRVISDSELMVKQIQGKYKVNSPDLKPLWQEAKNRIARLEAFEITHALRPKPHPQPCRPSKNPPIPKSFRSTPPPPEPRPSPKVRHHAPRIHPRR